MRHYLEEIVTKIKDFAPGHRNFFLVLAALASGGARAGGSRRGIGKRAGAPSGGARGRAPPVANAILE